MSKLYNECTALQVNSGCHNFWIKIDNKCLKSAKQSDISGGWLTDGCLPHKLPENIDTFLHFVCNYNQF